VIEETASSHPISTSILRRDEEHKTKRERERERESRPPPWTAKARVKREYVYDEARKRELGNLFSFFLWFPFLLPKSHFESHSLRTMK